MSGSSACVIGGPTADLKAVLGTVAEAMPELLAYDRPVRCEAYLDRLRVVAQHEQDVLLVRVPSIALRRRDEVGLQLGEVQQKLTDLAAKAVGDPGADGFVLMELGGRLTLTVGLQEDALTPVDLSLVPGIAGSFPKVGTIASEDLLAVALHAAGAGGTGDVTVHVKVNGFEFRAVAGSTPARVKLTDASRLAALDDVFSIEAERLSGVVAHLGERDVEVRFTTVHDGAFVALVSEDGHVEAQLHLTPVTA
jgi:hypothetical protein